MSNISFDFNFFTKKHKLTKIREEENWQKQQSLSTSFKKHLKYKTKDENSLK